MNKLLVDLPEVIETSRLLLQCPKAGWGEKVYAALLDGYEDYVKWLCWPSTPPTQEIIEAECRKHHAEFILRDFIRYLVVDKSNSEVLGRCAFPSFQANWSIPQFGISYFIRRSHRVKGHATEAVYAMSVLAFDILEARKIEIYCDAENLSSCKIPEKLNFELEYTQRGGWPRPDGQLAILKTYSLFNKNLLPNWEVKW